MIIVLKKEVDRLYKTGVYSEEEYESILGRMSENNNGELLGGVPDGCSLKYSLKFDLKTKPLVDIVADCSPWLGADHDFPELFGKYGYTYCGICDGFEFFRTGTINDIAKEHGYKPLDEATDVELWKMLALSNTYWLNSYREWYYKKTK